MKLRGLRYGYVLIDADHTLLDFEQAEKIALASVLSEYGLVLSEALYSAYCRINHELWHRYELGEVSGEFVQTERFAILSEQFKLNICSDADSIYQRQLQFQSQVLPGAEEFCAEVSKLVPLSVITNGVAKTQKSRLEQSSIYKYLNSVFTSGDIGHQKPDPTFFDAVCNIIGSYPKKEILVVGDSLYSDIFGGNQLGMDTCWFNPKSLVNKSDIEPTYEVKDLHEILLLF